MPHAVVARALYNFPDHLTNNTDVISGDALPAFRKNDTILITREVLKTRDSFHQERSRALVILTDAAAADGDLVESLENGTASLAGFRLQSQVLSELLAQTPAIAEAADVLAQFSRIAGKLEKYGVGKARSLGDLRRLVPLVELVSTAPPSTDKLVCPALFFPSAADSLVKAKEEAAALIARKEALDTTFIVDDAEAPETIDEQRKTLRGTGGSFFSIFNKDYRKSRHTVLGYLRLRKLFKLPEILESLEVLQIWQRELGAFNASKVFQDALGSGFVGVDSDWRSLQAALDWCQRLGSRR